MATLYRYENNINLIKYRHFDGPGILVILNNIFINIHQTSKETIQH